MRLEKSTEAQKVVAFFFTTADNGCKYETAGLSAKPYQPTTNDE